MKLLQLAKRTFIEAQAVRTANYASCRAMNMIIYLNCICHEYYIFNLVFIHIVKFMKACKCSLVRSDKTPRRGGVFTQPGLLYG